MNIIVLIKPVSEKYVNNNSANEENLVINPYDLYALSNIVELKNKNKDIHITCISIGFIKSKERTDKMQKLSELTTLSYYPTRRLRVQIHMLPSIYWNRL